METIMRDHKLKYWTSTTIDIVTFRRSSETHVFRCMRNVSMIFELEGLIWHVKKFVLSTVCYRFIFISSLWNYLFVEPVSQTVCYIKYFLIYSNRKCVEKREKRKELGTKGSRVFYNVRQSYQWKEMEGLRFQPKVLHETIDHKRPVIIDP